MTLDISRFDVKRPPRKTPAFHEIVPLSQVPEDEELADVLEALGDPAAVTVDEVKEQATKDKNHTFAYYLALPANARRIPHRFAECGYTAIRPGNTDGRWWVKGKRQTVYARADLAQGERTAAAQKKADATVVELTPK